jgi:hypothetical protein
MDALIAMPAAMFLAAGLMLSLFRGRLVRRQHEIARDAWLADSHAPGIAWVPPGTSLERVLVRGRVMSRWLWSTPQWIHDDPVARGLQRRMRLTWLTGIIAWLWVVMVLLTRGIGGS